MPGGMQDHRVRAVVLMAPHVIVEDVSVASIAAIKTAYETTDLKSRLARWHRMSTTLLWLERRLAPTRTSAAGYFRISRLYPRTHRRHPGRRGPIWDHPAGRDCQGECYCPVEVTILPEPDTRRIVKRRERR